MVGMKRVYEGVWSWFGFPLKNSVYVCVRACVRAEDVGSSGAGVTCNSELPGVGAGN